MTQYRMQSGHKALQFLETYDINIAENINELSNLCYGLSRDSGWWDGLNRNDPYVISTKLNLIHSEVSEATEGFREGLKDEHLPERDMSEVELADTLIRVFDLAGAQGMDLGGALVEKLKYNQDRPDHKPENRAKEGGKVI